MTRRPGPVTDYWCPHDGALLEYVGYYRCTSCRRTVDIQDFARPEHAAEMRRGREAGQMLPFEPAGGPDAT